MSQWRSAFRLLARRPAFAATTILILALGIGATTTLFSLIDSVLWKPLPYPDPDRLVTVYESNPAQSQNTSLMAPARIEDWNRLSESFESISGSYSENVTDTSGTDPERLAGRRVAPRFFSVYGATPLAGRAFTPDEENFGGPTAAIISYRVWQRRYHGDPSAVGKRLVLGGAGYTIVGVMPDGFAAPTIDLWMPAQVAPSLMQVRDARFFGGIGRMKPGVSVRDAQSELARVQAHLGEQFPKTDQGWSAQVTDLKEARVGDQRASLSLMFAAVVLLLLIACANAGGLMLGQIHRRERELAIRSSLGATRARLVGVIMREVALLVTAGAAIGFGLSLWGVNVVRIVFPNVPRIEQVHLDWRALLFTVTASILATVVFGLAPALETLRTETSGRLYQATRTQARGRRLLQRALVASQFAVTVVLLVGAGLVLRSYSKLTGVAPGFDPNHVFIFHVGAEWGEDRPSIGRLQQRILEELQRLPGVEAAGMTNFLPAEGATLRFEFGMEGAAGDADTGKILAGERTIGGGYLQALRMPLLQGEGCSALTTNFNAPVKVMVNQRFVEKFANGAGVIGRHLRVASQPWSSAAQIAGVVADAKEDGLDAPPYPYVYMCLAGGSWPDPEYVVRTRGDPRQIQGSVRQMVKGIAPDRAVFGMKTLEEHLETSLDTPRLSAEVLMMFAGIALTLAAVGLYSLVMLAVTASTKEIGLRVALGAQPRRIVASVVAGAALPVLFGLGIGGAIAFFAMRLKLLQPMLFGVDLTDSITMLSVIATLALVSVLAALGPARRAARIDPIQALREEG